jgi:hypothetical protein
MRDGAPTNKAVEGAPANDRRVAPPRVLKRPPPRTKDDAKEEE